MVNQTLQYQTIPFPAELAAALDADPTVKSIFERMPPSHQREYAGYVAEAKKPETRVRRAQKAVGMIRDWGEREKMSKGEIKR